MSPTHTVSVVLLTAEVPQAGVIEHYAKSADESLTVLPSANGATSSVFDANGQRLLVLSVPRLIEYAGDLTRVLGVPAADLPARPQIWTEAVAWHYEPNLGAAIAIAVAEHCGGKAVIRNTGDVL